jgi:hypothetical protein
MRSVQQFTLSIDTVTVLQLELQYLLGDVGAVCSLTKLHAFEKRHLLLPSRISRSAYGIHKGNRHGVLAACTDV